MKYSLNRQFKSLNPFEITLPDFVILTGINGVGKTQILQALVQQERSATLTENDKELISIRMFDSRSLEPNLVQQIGVNTYNRIENQVYPNARKFDQHFRLFEKMLECKRNNTSLISESDYLNQNLPEQSYAFRRHKIPPQKNVDITVLKFFDLHLNSLPQDYSSFAKKFELTFDPFSQDLFQQNFTQIFFNYQNLIHKNQYNEFKKCFKNQDVNYLTNDEFKKLNGIEPWILINKLLSEANLDFEFQTQKEFDLEQTTYDANFVKKSTGIKIPISDLSSGEKILISLFFAIYNKDKTNILPNVILLDETDASLHPSMSKQYLSILKNIFVKELGIKIILTTHSPSTVALADEQDVFIVEKICNENESPIKKCTKDQALAILTTGVPSLSINYENRKQVFVESPNDVDFYEEIYKKLKFKLIPEISLNFISSGDSRIDLNGGSVANCSQVKKITHVMRENGNKSCFGIIDWDLKNKETHGVYVNAIEQFYSIENCLLNPLAIGLILIHEKDSVIDELDIKIRELNYSDVNELQKITDWVVNKIKPNFHFQSSLNFKVKLVNGLSIEIPDWFCHHQGHLLETNILKVFPNLYKIKQNNEKQLKLSIITKVFGEFPELIPYCFLDTFSKIQLSQ